MKRADLVRYGADQLFAAETSVQVALTQSASLMAELSRMNLESNIALDVGQDALADGQAALAALIEARSAYVRMHERLNTVKRRLGCETVAVGGYEKPEKDKSPPPPTGFLPADGSVAA